MSEVTKEEWHKVFKEELFEFTPRTELKKYPWQVAKILIALSSIDVKYRDALITDKSKFVDFNVEGSELEPVSKIIGVKIKGSDKISDIAKIMFDRK
jgi:hypothetical protein